ncbi:RNA polymerase sigma factor [Caldimonas sp. KR1-144]|uniref:RNA polymerase sigma factor n=1 Tax=Caldimonas sp. KR1-144 TaxID=3400911 RepID=UPI003C00B827
MPPGTLAVSRLTQWLGASRPEAGDDWQLWREACDGREASATRLVRALTPQALGLALQMLGRREDAEDAVQDAFARLWRSAPSDTRGARLSTYFNTIVINRCKSLLGQRREQGMEPEALVELHDARQHDEAPQQEHRASRHRIGEALARLPARQRMAVAMWAYADASVADIARALELDPNAAHQLLYRAKLALRSRLEGEAT